MNTFVNRPIQEPGYRTVLNLLADARQSAAIHRRDRWDFAVEISELSKIGIEKHLLRVMVCQGVIEHKRETTKAGQENRSFELERDVVLSDQSCFVISDLGMRQFATGEGGNATMNKENRSEGTDQLAGETNGVAKNNGNAGPVPVWDTLRRELRLGNVVVKRFKWPAANQEQILRAFQEEGWPAKIDDPLPPNPKICPKRRLHDTIKCLNRRQVNRAIKFRGDGTGQGVILEIRPDYNDE